MRNTKGPGVKQSNFRNRCRLDDSDPSREDEEGIEGEGTRRAFVWRNWWRWGREGRSAGLPVLLVATT